MCVCVCVRACICVCVPYNVMIDSGKVKLAHVKVHGTKREL